jgi:hypothetical protein
VAANLRLNKTALAGVSLGTVQFSDFVLQLDVDGRGGLRARVLQSPFGEAAAPFSLPWSAEAVKDALRPRGLEVASGVPVITRGDGYEVVQGAAPPPPPLEVGETLFRSVFQGQVRTLFDKSFGQLELEATRGLRLKLKLDPNDAATAALADLPWELLRDADNEYLFALSRQTTLVRYLDVPRPSQPIPFTPPLRILAASASPRGKQPLDVDEECRRLGELKKKMPGIDVIFLPNATPGTVRQALADGPCQILHFMGHGDFDSINGEGLLFFERPDGGPDPVSARAFATQLRDLRTLGVVVLNACNTARASHQAGRSPFRGAATALVQGGVPAVVAMQYPISDRSAIAFSTAFYRHLSRGEAIDVALTEGRQAIYSANPDASEWAIPVLFLRVADGQVFVARPAAEPVAPPEPIAPAAHPPAMPVPLEVRQRAAADSGRERRRWPAKGIAAAGGAGVILTVLLYTQIHHGAEKSATPPNNETSDFAQTTDLIPKPPEPHPENKVDPKRPHDETHQKDPKQDVLGGSGPKDGTEEQNHSQQDQKAPAAISDPSVLTTQAVSIAPRGEGGLRVRVSFTNTSSQPLSLILDAESCDLSDNQGMTYGLRASDLPTKGSGYLLSLPPRAVEIHSFDFPLPKSGSTVFYLALATSEGQRVPLPRSPLKLEGSP